MLGDIRGHSRCAGLAVERRVLPRVRAEWDAWHLAPNDEPVNRVEIYTDGAATLRGTWPRMAARAGWAAVLLALVPEPGGGLRRALLGAIWGPVVTVPGDEGFMGAARPTAPAAEHSAALAVLTLIARRPELLGATIVLESDAAHTVGVVNFRQALGSNVELAGRLRFRAAQLRSAAAGLYCVRVPGHSAIAGNELADLAATIGMDEGPSHPGLLAAIAEQPRAPLPGRRTLQLHAELFWTEALEGQAPAAQPSRPAPPPRRAQACGHQELLLATANVLTLRPAEEADGAASVRRCQLADLMAHQGVHVLGIQEARSRKEFAREQCDYVMVASAADRAGNYGTELWFHRDTGVKLGDIWRLRSEPRLLVVRAIACGIDAIWLAAHAPSGDPTWWTRLAETVRQLNAFALPVVALVDANAHLGSDTSPFVGSADAEGQCAAGEAMHQALAELHLAAPATFLGGGPTWRHPLGAWSRCDYVLIPHLWLAACVQTFTDADAALAIGFREDHRVVFAKLELANRPVHLGTAAAPGPWAQPRDVWAKPEVAAELERRWGEAPSLPDYWPAQLAENALTAFSTAVAVAACPRQQARPKRPWISADTWTVIRLHAAARKSFFRLARSGAAGDRVGEARAALRAAARAAAGAAAADKVSWIAETAAELSEDWRVGAGTRLWRLARALGPKATGKPAAPLIRDETGEVVQTQDQLLAMWERRFAAEFLGRAYITDRDAYDRGLAQDAFQLPSVPDEEAIDVHDWANRIACAIAKAKRGRMAGTDGIPVEFMRAAGPSYVARLAEVARATQWSPIPVGWRLGIMVPVPRKPGVALSLAASRGVLAGSHVGKAIAKATRSALAPLLKCQAGDEQQGAVQHGGTEFTAHTVRLFFRRARLSNKCAAVVFADLKSAFYSVLQEMAVGACMPAADRQAAFVRAGMTPEAAAELSREILERQPVIQAMGAAATWQRLALDWHRHSGFLVRGGTRVVANPFGTRPGDPLADLVFAAAFTIYQQAVSQLVDGLALTPAPEVTGPGVFQPTEEHAAPVAIGNPAYMDDMAIPIEAPTADELLEALPRLAAGLVQVAARFGLSLNLQAGKTEAVLDLAGPGRDRVRALLADLPTDETGHAALLPTPGGAPLRVVKDYKHVGLRTAPGLTQLREITARAAAANSASRALARVVGNPRYPSEARTAVAEACVETRALHAAGVWDPLPRGQFRIMRAAVMRPLRMAAGAHRRPREGEVRRSSRQVCADLGAAELAPRLAAARIRYAVRASLWAPASLRGLLRSPPAAAWRAALVRDLRGLREVVAPKLDDLPDPEAAMHEWEALWTEATPQFLELVRKAVKGCLHWPGALGQDSESDQGDLDDDGQLCGTCGKVFASRVALLMHARTVHGFRTRASHCVAGSICPCCGKDYHVRPRLIRHLCEGRHACAQAAAAGALPPLPPELFAAEAARDKALWREARRAGVNLLCGPPPRPAGQLGAAAAAAAAVAEP